MSVVFSGSTREINLTSSSVWPEGSFTLANYTFGAAATDQIQAGKLSQGSPSAVETIGVASIPPKEENELLTAFKDAVVDNVASMLIGATIGAIGAGVVLARNRLGRRELRYHNQIAVETLEFRRNGSGDPYIAFRRKPAIELDDILDPAGLDLFQRGLRDSKRDSLSFLTFKSTPHNIAHHVIGNPMAEWAEQELAGTVIDLNTAMSRMSCGLQHPESSREVCRLFGFFTCDKIGSVEQPRLVLVQKEDLVNVILDLPLWWKATEHESALEEADSKTNLGRIIEFAVSILIRHPQALVNSFSDPEHNQKAVAAIEKAETLKKILAEPPELTTEWLNRFVNFYANGDQSGQIGREFVQTEADWESVLKDWYCTNNLGICRAALEKERALESFGKLLDISVRESIPMWCMLIDIPTASD